MKIGPLINLLKTINNGCPALVRAHFAWAQKWATDYSWYIHIYFISIMYFYILYNCVCMYKMHVKCATIHLIAVHGGRHA